MASAADPVVLAVSASTSC